MKIEVTKKDVIWSYIGTFISLCSNIIMIPFIMYYLNEDMLGLWYIFTSIGGIATLFDFGFGVTFARNVTYCWSGVGALKKDNAVFSQNKEPDYNLMNNVLITCRRIYFLISATVLLFLGTAGTMYIMYISREIEGYYHIIAWAVYAVAIFLNLYYGYYASFLRGVGAVAQANKNTVISRGIQIMVTIGMLMLGTGLIGACAAYLVYGTVFRMLGKYKFYHYKNIGNELNKIHTKPSAEEMKILFFTVWHNAWREGLISICNYSCNQISTLICSLYLTLGETGTYSLGVQIATAVSTVAAALYSAYQPALQASYVNEDKERTKSIMSLIVSLYIIVFIIGLFGAVVVGLPILRMIKPESTVTSGILIGLLLYQFILNFRNCYTSYFSCTNRLPYVKSFIISAIFCVFLSFLFIGPLKLGISGLVIAQIISQGMYNMWYWPVKAQKEMNLSLKEMPKRAIVQIKIIVSKRGK